MEQVELPATPKRHFEIKFVKNQKFRGEKIVVDNHQFEDCHFENCNFVYFGGHFAFANCTIEGSCQFSPTGAAHRTMNLYRALLPQIENSNPPY
jgi:hypothetical protein